MHKGTKAERVHRTHTRVPRAPISEKGNVKEDDSVITATTTAEKEETTTARRSTTGNQKENALSTGMDRAARATIAISDTDLPATRANRGARQ